MQKIEPQENDQNLEDEEPEDEDDYSPLQNF